MSVERSFQQSYLNFRKWNIAQRLVTEITGGAGNIDFASRFAFAGGHAKEAVTYGLLSSSDSSLAAVGTAAVEQAGSSGGSLAARAAALVRY